MASSRLKAVLVSFMILFWSSRMRLTPPTDFPSPCFIVRAGELFVRTACCSSAAWPAHMSVTRSLALARYSTRSMFMASLDLTPSSSAHVLGVWLSPKLGIFFLGGLTGASSLRPAPGLLLLEGLLLAGGGMAIDYQRLLQGARRKG